MTFLRNYWWLILVLVAALVVLGMRRGRGNKS